MPLRWMFICFNLLLAAEGCAKVKAAVCADMVPAPKPGATPDKAAGTTDTPASSTPAADGDTEPATLTSEVHSSSPQEQFALPFAWEKSPDEPLSKTRAYLREMARDNGTYMRRGAAYFKPFANAETPRATVVSCADSRVQAGAWDGSPENDAFTVRNLGNQIDPGIGTIQYGVDALNTPLLVVLGHTGCTAIKAAMTGTTKLSEPIRRELAALKVGKRAKPKKLDDKAFAQAAVDNVNDQVERALSTFAARVNAGQLTIIGAIYDFRNDLGKGPGRVSIVNVNGTTETARLKAFSDAVLAGADLNDPKAKLDPFERLSQVFAEHLRTEEQVEDVDDEDELEASALLPQLRGRAPAPTPPPSIPEPAEPAPEATKPAREATKPAHAAEVPAGAIPAAAAKPHH
jgi:carbonic anhydrase